MAYLSEIVKISLPTTTTEGASGTADITSDVVDMSGYEGCLFIVPVGAVAASAVTTIKVQQCDTSGGSYADLEGTAVSIADDEDNTCKYVDVKLPRERYLKVVVERDGTNAATIGAIVALQYGARSRSVSHAADVAGEQHSSAAEGTA